MSYFLLGLFKLHQKYADGQNDPERFSISSAFPFPWQGLPCCKPYSLLQTGIKMPAQNALFFSFSLLNSNLHNFFQNKRC